MVGRFMGRPVNQETNFIASVVEGTVWTFV